MRYKKTARNSTPIDPTESSPLNWNVESSLPIGPNVPEKPEPWEFPALINVVGKAEVVDCCSRPAVCDDILGFVLRWILTMDLESSQFLFFSPKNPYISVYIRDLREVTFRNMNFPTPYDFPRSFCSIPLPPSLPSWSFSRLWRFHHRSNPSAQNGGIQFTWKEDTFFVPCIAVYDRVINRLYHAERIEGNRPSR